MQVMNKTTLPIRFKTSKERRRAKKYLEEQVKEQTKKREDKYLLAAKAICIADAQDWNTLEQTYNGRQETNKYCRFAVVAIKAFNE